MLFAGRVLNAFLCGQDFPAGKPLDSPQNVVALFQLLPRVFCYNGVMATSSGDDAVSKLCIYPEVAENCVQGCD
jgi:hypothetical protein